MADASVLEQSGIYEIVNTVNGKRYVGSAVIFKRRWSFHKAQLKMGTHHNGWLQRSWIRHGGESFVFRILILCDKKNLIMYEQIAIDGLNPEYNIQRVAGSALGVSLPKSPEHRKKLSEALMGHRFNAGIPKSEAHRRKLSEVRTGVPNPKNLGNKSRTGMKTAPLEVARRATTLKATWTRRKAEALESGVPVSHPHSDDRRQAISDRLKQFWADPAKRERMLEKCRATRERSKLAKLVET